MNTNKIDEIKKEAREQAEDLFEFEDMRGDCSCNKYTVLDFIDSKLDSAISVCETECQAKIKAREDEIIEKIKGIKIISTFKGNEESEERAELINDMFMPSIRETLINLIKSSELGQIHDKEGK